MSPLVWLRKVILIYGGVGRVAPDIISRNGPLNVIVLSSCFRNKCPSVTAPELLMWDHFRIPLNVAPVLFYFQDICSLLCQAKNISHWKLNCWDVLYQRDWAGGICLTHSHVLFILFTLFLVFVLFVINRTQQTFLLYSDLGYKPY